MNFKATVLLSLTILVLFSSIAFAQSADLSLSTNSAKLCPGSTQQIIATLKNTGSTSDSYDITADSSYVTIAPSSVSLNAGASATIYIYVTPSVSATPGTSTITIQAKTSKQTISLEVLTCWGLSVTPKISSQSGCIGDSLSYDIDVRNLGKSSDTFTLSATKGAFSQSEVVIASNETKTVTLVVPAQNANVSVTAKAKSSPASGTTTVQASGKECYGGALTASVSSKTGCINDKLNYTFTISNAGAQDETFNLSATKGTLSANELTVGANKTADFSLAVSSTEMGEVVSTVNAKSLHLNLNASVTSKVSYCKGVAVLLTPSEMKSCAGATARYIVTLKNTGRVADSFKLSSDVGKITDSNISLQSGEIKTTYLEIGALKEQNFTVTAQSATDNLVSDSIAGKLNVESCYGATATIDASSKEACPGTTTDFIITIKNTGKNDDTYKISTILGKLSKENVTIKAGDAASITLSMTEQGSTLVKVSSDYAQQSIGANLTLKSATACYGFGVTSEKYLIKASEFKGYLFTLAVENKGVQNASYTVTASGPEWSYVDPKAFALGAGEKKNVFVYISPPYGTSDGIYTVTATITSDKSITTTRKVALALGNVSTAQIEKELAAQEQVQPAVSVPANITQPSKPTGPSLIDQIKAFGSKNKLAFGVVIAIIFLIALIKIAPRIAKKKVGKKLLKDIKAKVTRKK